MSTQAFVFRHAAVCSAGASFVFTVLSWQPSPSFVSLILLLGTLRVYSRIAFFRPGGFGRALLSWIVVTLALSITHILPSIHALSSPGVSLWVMTLMSGISSGIALATITLDIFICKQMKGRWAQITLFPAMWATVWWSASHLSPVGRLVTWSPVSGLEEYSWLKAYTGPVGIDWIVAAWAVVFAQAVGAWFVGPGPRKDLQVEQLISHEHLENDGTIHSRETWLKTSHVFVLTILLLVLAIPSHVMTKLPAPPFSKATTPLTVGCALPSSLYSKPSNSSSLDEHIITSAKMRAQGAHLILWPEGAVRFDGAQAREEAFERVRRELPGPYIGVAYEEPIPNDNNSHDDGRVGKMRNGITIVGPKGPVMTYYKRNLVPIAESFAFTPGQEPPSIYTVNLTNPKGMTKDDWNPEPPHIRPLTLTTSICLDFASPAPFAALGSRPSIILAPSRTWHSAVGLAMWEQAKWRAEEIGSTILWCDGGEGGLSGVAGRGMGDIMQVGDGYWIRTIGLPWPFDEGRSVYAVAGDFSVVLLLWVVLQAGSLSTLFAGFKLLWNHTGNGWGRVTGSIKGMINGWRDRRRLEGEREPLL